MTLTSTSLRTVGAVAVVTAAIPLVLSGCASPHTVGMVSAELQAGADSDLLEAALPRDYAVASAEVTAATASGTLNVAVGEAIADRLTTSGSMTVEGALITDARFTLRVDALPEAVFELSEPVVLRPQDSENRTVTAIGTLAVAGVVHSDLPVRLTPTRIDDTGAEVDAELEVPDSPLVAGAELPFDELTLHLVFDAEG